MQHVAESLPKNLRYYVHVSSRLWAKWKLGFRLAFQVMAIKHETFELCCLQQQQQRTTTTVPLHYYFTKTTTTTTAERRKRKSNGKCNFESTWPSYLAMIYLAKRNKASLERKKN